MALVTLESLRSRSITHAISLGAECVVAYNLRRFFNFSAAFPFDWWISPIASVCSLLLQFDTVDLYDPGKLSLLEGHISTVRHVDHGIWLHHEFPRAWNGTMGVVVADYADYIAKAKSRTLFLRERLLACNHAGNRILFVRKRSWAHDQGVASEYLELVEALSHVFPLVEFGVLLVNFHPNSSRDDTLTFAYTQAPEEPLRAANAEWDRILNDAGLHLDNPDLGLFSDADTAPE
ncbi:DUF1796 family putative cysteine peptidase [Lichenihabitans psoromatis]|uniref:DUF1796 family putative cysteine peptidase n=1 Tax=Lichenihabitans psoromatis TaxID=2528642 RepID=UPI001036F08E|nr:DUF1796 family putative cysteine peptidase [Lichenihabitans psoromatis]